jgi:hypothetical protein
MMKAREYNRRIFSEDVKPQVYTQKAGMMAKSMAV